MFNSPWNTPEFIEERIRFIESIPDDPKELEKFEKEFHKENTKYIILGIVVILLELVILAFSISLLMELIR
jgi:hypothetical protein